MNPWDVIGWIILVVVLAGFAVVALMLLAAMIFRFAAFLTIWRKRRQALRIEPKAGQRWVQDGSFLHIDRIADNGRIVIKSKSLASTASWSDSPEEWKKRIKNRNVWLYD